MAIWYLDPVNGTDSETTPYGWWKLAYTGASGSAPAADAVATGGTSGATAKLTIAPSGWPSNGTLYFYGKSGTFQSETVTFANGASCSVAGDATVCAWQTITSGALAARTAPGDIIRIAKTDINTLSPTSSWTNNSDTVTLSSAATLVIEDATSTTGWTASTDISLAAQSPRKLGTGALQITAASGFTTGKMVYYTFGSAQDFSSYDSISLWVYPSVNRASGFYTITLCSDTAGSTPVDTFTFPAITASRWNALKIDKDGGGSLGSSIQSIAINAVSDPGTSVLVVNNIFACTDVLNLQTVIGKGNTDGSRWYPIMSISGTTIKLDNHSTNASGYTYEGTTQSGITTYTRSAIATAAVTASTTVIFTINESGTVSGGAITYSGGWDMSTNTRTGQTWYNGICGYGVLCGLASRAFINIENIGAIYYGNLASVSTAIDQIQYKNCDSVHTSVSGITSGTGGSIVIEDSRFICASASGGVITQGGEVYISNCVLIGATYGLTCANGVRYLKDCEFAKNSVASIRFDTTSKVYARNCLFSDGTEISYGTSNKGSEVFSIDHDQVNGEYYIIRRYETIHWQTTEYHGSEPGSWEIFLTVGYTADNVKTNFKIADIACTTSSTTVSVWVKKGHATSISAALKVYADAVTGVTEQTDTKANDTDWEQLSVTFTPSQAGVVPIYIEYYCASAYYLYIGAISIS